MNKLSRLVLFVLMVLALPASVHAMSANPDILELRVTAGQRVTGSILVDTTQGGVDLDVQRFTIDQQGNSRSDETAPADLTWIKAPKSVAKSRKNKGKLEIPYEILISSNAKAEYTAKFLVSEQISQKSDSNSGVNIGLAIGIPVYVSVIKNETHSIAVDSFSYLSDVQKMKLTLRNDGTVQDRPVVTYTLYKFGGIWPFVSRDKIGSGDITRSWPILGGMKREFLSPIKLDGGDYELELNVNYGMRYGYEGHLQKTIAFSVR